MKSLIFLLLCVFASIAGVKAIAGGVDAKPHSAPFMVNIRSPNDPNNIYCGGVIIQNNVILTSIICIQNSSTITAGDHNIFVIEISEQKRSVSKIIKHPDNPGNPYMSSNIALVYLNLPFDFNEFVQPIALPNIDQCFDGETIAYGWGWLNREQQFPDVLQKIESEIIDRNLCKESVDDSFKLSSRNICTWSKGEAKAMNHRDDGGPLVQMNKVGRPYLIGIMSFSGIPGNAISGPTVFGNIAAMREFIDDTIYK